MNAKLNKILIIIASTILLISTTVFIYLLKNTYSSTDKYVVFKAIGDHVGEIIKSCKIGTDGKLDSACVDEAGKVCRRWSEFAGEYSSANSDGHNSEYDTCSNVRIRAQIRTDTIKTYTFSDDDEYFCVPCQSVAPDTWGCYVCDDNPTVIKWAINSTPTDENCPNNAWHKDTSITDDKECKYTPPAPTYACYECKTDKTIVDWRDSDAKDNQCSAGYKKLEGVTEANCKYVAPPSSSSTPTYACYECKTDKTIVDWRDSDAKDNQCSAGYKKLEGITEANCKYVAPPSSSPKSTYACYECKADKNIMRWKENALGDNMCPGGYNKTVKTKAQCNVDIPVNPPTGQTRYIITIIMASIAIGCSLWYLKKSV